MAEAIEKFGPHSEQARVAREKLKAVELPAPGDRYFEIEVAKMHGGMWQWEKLPTQRRAELIAHELHKNQREHYYHDVSRRDKKKGEKKTGLMPHEQMRERFFSPKKEIKKDG